jgi:alkanesulfonate monooxygenase SsuD/methylene tetrahydromethanopterin reductase-like flavin-dependent oxidoreductase (luciferase family)
VPALRAYRDAFRPSAARDRPYALIAALVVVAETQEEAEWLAAPNGLNLLRARTGNTGPFPTTAESDAYLYTPGERQMIDSILGAQFIGAPDGVHARVTHLMARSGADELMALTMLGDHRATLGSYELLSEVFAR